MSFPPVMDSTAQAKNRGTAYAGDQYMLLCSNTVALGARINGAPTGNAYAHVTFDTVTTGAYTNVKPNMTVIISHTSNPREGYFRGRARFDEIAGVVATATILYINETSQPISDNDYLFVIQDFGLHPKFAKATATTYFKDYNRPYAPPAPIIQDLQSAYAGVCDSDTDIFTLELNPSAFPVASGASIASYLFTIPASGVTVIGGSLSSNDVVLEFDASASEYWLSFKAVDDNGQSTTMWFPVWAIPSDLSTTIAVGFEGANLDMALDNGAMVSVNAFEGIEDILDQTLAVLFEVEYYDGEVGSLVSDIKFVGRIRRDVGSNTADEQASRVLNTSFEIEGMAAQLARTPMEHIKAVIKSSPSIWDEIEDLTPWRAICHMLRTHTTFCEINSLSFDDTTNTYLYPSFPTMGNSVADAIKDILESLNAGMEWAQSGEARIIRDLRYTSSGTRNAADTVMNFDAQDFLEIESLEYQHVDDAGLINGYAGSWSTASETEMIAQAKWPGITAGEGINSVPLNRQVIAANVNMDSLRTEIRRRVGYQGAVLNTRYRLTINHPDQYNWLTPSRGQWYTWTLSTTDQDNLRHTFTTAQRWLCESVSITHNNATGDKSTVQAVYILETTSVDGQDYDPPSSGGGEAPFLPDVPTMDVYPTWPDTPIIIPPDLPPEYAPPYIGSTSPSTSIAPMDGSVRVAVTHGTESHLWATRQGLLKNPPWVNIDPPLAAGERIYDAHMGRLGLLDVYVLASDGTNSRVYYLDNVLKNIRDWSTSSLIDGLFSHLVPAPRAGAVTIISESTNTIGVIADATVSGNGNNTGVSITSGDTVRLVTNNTKWNPNASVAVNAEGTLPYDAGSDPSNGSLILPSSTPGSLLYRIGTSGSWTYAGIDVTFTAASSGTLYLIMNEYIGVGASFSDNSGHLISTVNIGGTSNNVATRYSDDYGQNFDVVRVVGAAGSGSGADSIRAGDQFLATAGGQVKIATTPGGTYSNYGSTIPAGAKATALFLNRLEFGSTSVQNTQTITPEYLLASDTATGTSKTLWKVDTGGTNFIDITPTSGGNPGLAVSPDCIHVAWRSGLIILGIFDFGGTRKLARSLNAGSSWTISSALDSGARCLVTIVNDKASRQAWFAGGSNGVGYLSNYQTSLSPVYQKLPTNDPCILVDVYL